MSTDPRSIEIVRSVERVAFDADRREGVATTRVAWGVNALLKTRPPNLGAMRRRSRMVLRSVSNPPGCAAAPKLLERRGLAR